MIKNENKMIKYKDIGLREREKSDKFIKNSFIQVLIHIYGKILDNFIAKFILELIIMHL